MPLVFADIVAEISYDLMGHRTSISAETRNASTYSGPKEHKAHDTISSGADPAFLKRGGGSILGLQANKMSRDIDAQRY